MSKKPTNSSPDPADTPPATGLEVDVQLEQTADKFVEKEIGHSIPKDKPAPAEADPDAESAQITPEEIENQLKDAQKKMADAAQAVKQASQQIPEGKPLANEIFRAAQAHASGEKILTDATKAVEQKKYDAAAGLIPEAIKLADQAISLAGSAQPKGEDDSTQADDSSTDSKTKGDKQKDQEEARADIEKKEQAAKEAVAKETAAVEKKAVAAVAKKAFWMNPITWTVTTDVLIGILVVVVALSFIFRESGPRPPESAQHVKDDARIADLLRLAGDLKAREQLLGETAQELCSALDKAKTQVANLEESKRGKAEAQLTKTRQVVNQLLAALNRSACAEEGTPAPSPQATPTSTESTQPSTGKKQLSPNIIKIRDSVIVEIKELLRLLEVSCDNLPAPNKYGVIQLPDSAAYGQKYQPRHLKWGNQKMVCFLQKVGTEWNRRHPGHLMEVLDVSNEYGTTPANANGSLRHRTHTGGEAADLWALGLTPSNNDQPYDRDLTREFVKLMWDNGAIDVILNDAALNDEVYKGHDLTRFVSGHYDHFHIVVR